MRPRTPAAALIEKHDTVHVGIEKLPVIWLTARTRSTMQENDGDTVVPAAFLDMQPMAAGHRQCMRYVWLDRWKQLEHELHAGKGLPETRRACSCTPFR